MLKELDVVTLTHDIQEHGLNRGSRGAIVHCYKDGQAFEVEFVSEMGGYTGFTNVGESRYST